VAAESNEELSNYMVCLPREKGEVSHCVDIGEQSLRENVALLHQMVIDECDLNVEKDGSHRGDRGE
jgi:hypothetical protein